MHRTESFNARHYRRRYHYHPDGQVIHMTLADIYICQGVSGGVDPLPVEMTGGEYYILRTER